MTLVDLNANDNMRAVSSNVEDSNAVDLHARNPNANRGGYDRHHVQADASPPLSFSHLAHSSQFSFLFTRYLYCYSTTRSFW